MRSQLSESCSSLSDLFLWFSRSQSLWLSGGVALSHRSSILNDLSPSCFAHFLLSAVATSLVTFFNLGACVIFLANRHLCAVNSVLAVENVRAIKVNLRRIDVLDHIASKLRKIIRHSQWVAQVLRIIQLLLVVVINLLLNLIYLRLDISERPLLGLLHLDHHLLDLLELLERISLHRLKLFLLWDKHVETSLIVVTKESMLDEFAIPCRLIHFDSWFGESFEALVELINALFIFLRVWLFCILSNLNALILDRPLLDGKVVFWGLGLLLVLTTYDRPLQSLSFYLVFNLICGIHWVWLLHELIGPKLRIVKERHLAHELIWHHRLCLSTIIHEHILSFLSWLLHHLLIVLVSFKDLFVLFLSQRLISLQWRILVHQVRVVIHRWHLILIAHHIVRVLHLSHVTLAIHHWHRHLWHVLKVRIRLLLWPLLLHHLLLRHLLLLKRHLLLLRQQLLWNLLWDLNLSLLLYRSKNLRILLFLLLLSQSVVHLWVELGLLKHLVHGLRLKRDVNILVQV